MINTLCHNPIHSCLSVSYVFKHIVQGGLIDIKNIYPKIKIIFMHLNATVAMCHSQTP